MPSQTPDDASVIGHTFQTRTKWTFTFLTFIIQMSQIIRFDFLIWLPYPCLIPLNVHFLREVTQRMERSRSTQHFHCEVE